VVGLAQDITPGAAARRSVLADALGGLVATLTLLLLLPWFAVEAPVRRVRRRRGAKRTRPVPRLGHEDVENPGV
jgi:hypothetical protein